MGKNDGNRRRMRKRRRWEGQELVLGDQFSAEVLDNVNTEEAGKWKGENKNKVTVLNQLQEKLFYIASPPELFVTSKFCSTLNLSYKH